MALIFTSSLIFNLSSSPNFLTPKPKIPPFSSNPIFSSKSPPSSIHPFLFSTSKSPFPTSPRSHLILPAFSSSSSPTSFRFFEVDDDLDSSPWEGALVYKRDPSVSHVEFCTTLERLGLGKLSSPISGSRASDIGLRVTKAVKDFPLGTPVHVSVDVTRKKKKLRLDGILRTVISLGCNRCGEPAAECIFSNFTLLLTEEPIGEPDSFFMGTIYGEEKSKTSSRSSDEDDNEDSIDLEDQLYFPAEEKEVDISKHIRDMIHVEITINAVCDPKCKGLCLKCGTNLNKSGCNCSKSVAQGKDMATSEA